MHAPKFSRGGGGGGGGRRGGGGGRTFKLLILRAWFISITERSNDEHEVSEQRL